MATVTKAEYARRNNMTRQALNHHLQRGDVPVEPDGTIDPDKADAALAEKAETPSLSKVKAATEAVKLRLARVDLEERLGNLLKVADVEQSMSDCFERWVFTIDKLPEIADEITDVCGGTDANAARKLLRETTKKMRREIAANMRLLEQGDRTDDDDGSY